MFVSRDRQSAKFTCHSERYGHYIKYCSASHGLYHMQKQRCFITSHQRSKIFYCPRAFSLVALPDTVMIAAKHESAAEERTAFLSGLNESTESWNTVKSGQQQHWQ